MIDPSHDPEHFIRGLAHAASVQGILHYTSTVDNKVVLRRGGFALFSDYGPSVEGNTAPVATPVVVYIRENEPHSLYGIEINPDGSIQVTSKSYGLMVYPARFDEYDEQYARCNPKHRVKLEYIASFEAPTIYQ